MHHLQGPRLKIRRAIKHLNTLDQSIQGFLKSEPYRIVVNTEEKPGWYVARAEVLRGPDPNWGVIIGELCHNLRSALDGIVWQLSLLTSTNPYSRTQFPIFLRGDTVRLRRGSNQKIPHFNHDGRILIQSVKPKHRTLIEGFQPYKRATGGFSSPLWLLQEINNADKHRLLQAIIGQVVGTSLGIRAMSGVDIRTGRMFNGRPLNKQYETGRISADQAEGGGICERGFQGDGRNRVLGRMRCCQEAPSHTDP